MNGPIAQLVEHSADNAGVSGSSPLGPTKFHVSEIIGPVAQLGEHLLCKQGVSGSIPLRSTKNFISRFFSRDCSLTISVSFFVTSRE